MVSKDIIRTYLIKNMQKSQKAGLICHFSVLKSLKMDYVPFCSVSIMHPKARWQNGDAADCKSVNAGSIPARASTSFKLNQLNIV